MKPILPIAALAALLLLPAPSPAVTRGEVVKESNYPWLADLLGCGGTLIAPDRVLTAAHCIMPLEGFEEIELTLGESFDDRAPPEGPPARASTRATRTSGPD